MKHKIHARVVQPSIDRKYLIEDAARTLVRSEEIRSDRSLFSAAQRELKRQQVAVNKAMKR